MGKTIDRDITQLLTWCFVLTVIVPISPPDLSTESVIANYYTCTKWLSTETIDSSQLGRQALIILSVTITGKMFTAEFLIDSTRSVNSRRRHKLFFPSLCVRLAQYQTGIQTYMKIYNLHYNDVQVDVLGPPHGTTPAAVKIKSY